MAPDFAAAGAEIVAISVDDVGANAAMTEKLGLPFALLADPVGELLIKPFGVWDGEEEIARTAVVVLKPDGREAFRHVGIDYADRAVDEDVLAVVRALGLAPRPSPVGVRPHGDPKPSGEAYDRSALLPYFRGVRSASKALAGRTGDEGARRLWATAERYVAALEK